MPQESKVFAPVTWVGAALMIILIAVIFTAVKNFTPPMALGVALLIVCVTLAFLVAGLWDSLTSREPRIAAGFLFWLLFVGAVVALVWLFFKTIFPS